MVIDELIVKENGIDKSIDSADNKTIDIIHVEDSDYHFAKEKQVVGLSSVTVGNAVNEPLIDMQISGNSVQNILPDEYQQVEYIETTGTQYIDSDFNPDSNTTIEMDLFMKSDTSTTDAKNNFVFGVSNGSTHERRFALNLFRRANTTILDVYPRFSTNAPSSGVSSIDFDKWYNIRLDKGSYYINNVVVASYESTFEKNEYSLYINAYNSYGSVNTSYIGNIKLKSCKIWDNTILARDLIPCYRKSDNVIGMYDVVNDVFYTNAGTGEFLKGNDAPTPETPIEIESVGERTLNLFDASQIPSITGIVVEDKGKKIIMPVVTNGNGHMSTRITLKQFCPNLRVGDEVYLLFDSSAGDINKIIYLSISDYLWYERGRRVITQQDLDSIVGLYANRYTDGYMEQVILSNFRIVKSNTTEFEPYGYKVPVKVGGKNLFDKSKALLGQNLNASTGGLYNSTARCVSDYIEVDSTLKYTFDYTYPDNATRYLCCYDENKNFMTSAYKVVEGDSRKYAVVEFVKSEVKYIRANCFWSADGSQSEIDDFMIIQGQYNEDTMPSYEPYIEPVTTNIYLTEPLRKVGE